MYAQNSVVDVEKVLQGPHGERQMFIQKMDSEGTSVKTACSSGNELSIGLR